MLFSRFDVGLSGCLGTTYKRCQHPAINIRTLIANPSAYFWFDIMPATTSGKVLVSGANGYVASWVVRTLLESGFSVRATVRSESKGVHLRKLFASYSDRLELVVVPDITAVCGLSVF